MPREEWAGALSHIYKPIIISLLISLCFKQINFLLCRCVHILLFPLRFIILFLMSNRFTRKVLTMCVGVQCAFWGFNRISRQLDINIMQHANTDLRIIIFLPLALLVNYFWLIKLKMGLIWNCSIVFDSYCVKLWKEMLIAIVTWMEFFSILIHLHPSLSYFSFLCFRQS